MIKTKVVSENKIKVPRIEHDQQEVKGADWFPTKYPNMYACSMKGSGKTVALTNAMWHCIGSKTKVIICCPTVNIDPTYIATVKKLNKSGYSVETFSGIVDDGVNVIEDFLIEQKDNELKDNTNTAAGLAIGTVVAKPVRTLLFGGSNATVKPVVKPIAKPAAVEKKVKGRKITPDWIIIIDDCGAEARNKFVQQLMKINRHYHAMVLVASQDLHDLAPSSIKQLQYVLLFARFPLEKLVSLYKSLELSIPLDKFLEYYHDATSQKYGFLYIGRESSGDVFRKNYTEQYI